MLGEIAVAGGEGMAIAADICDRSAMAEAVSQAEARFGPDLGCDPCSGYRKLDGHHLRQERP